MTRKWRSALPVTEEIYERVVSDGQRRRRSRRYRLIALGACTAVLIAVVASFALRSDNKPGEVVTVGPAPVCRNSAKPECGPFRWDPAPADNQPLTATVSFTPQNPRVGETVTFTVHAEDPDASIPCVGLTFPLPEGIAGEFCSRPTLGCGGDEPHGPWDTPAAMPSSVDRVFTHVFSSSGAATVSVLVTSRSSPLSRLSLCPDVDSRDPYKSSATLSVTVDVAP
jgi:hypothetical protein